MPGMRYAGWITGLAASLCGFAAGFSVPAQAAGDPNHLNVGECRAATEASPGFRAYLPDCRAYELVTPPFKYGEPPLSNTSTGIAADGSSITFSSIGAFAEPGNDTTPEGGEYVDTRNATGWSATPVNPPATQFQGGSPDLAPVAHETLDYSSDLTHSLILEAPNGAKRIDARFYLRNLADGSAVEVGSLLSSETVANWNTEIADAGDTAAPEYVGATNDLSHVLFSQLDRSPTGPTYLWPGDRTVRGERSLYEYVGVGSAEPELVGVKNNTSLAAAASAERKLHINEAAEEIGQCGVVLGGADARRYATMDSYNALSASGKTVYFTVRPGGCTSSTSEPPEVGSGPPVFEIYARVDRERTVAISEPTTGSSGDCARCDESEPQDALFQGASQDGTRIFFLSAQKLFGGVEGETGTNLYEYNFAGPPGEKLNFLAPELASTGSGSGGVVRVAENGTHVYFVSQAVLGGIRPNEFGAAAQIGADNLYLYDTEAHRAVFVARLSTEDQDDWLAEDGSERNVEATPDGRFLLFPSTADLTTDASGSGRQLYRYDATPSAQEEAAGVPRLVRVSVGARGNYECPVTKKVEQGFNCDGNNLASLSSGAFIPAYDHEANPGFGSRQHAYPSTVAISADGSRVFFQSPVGLTPGAINNACAFEAYGECWSAIHNVYEWENGRIYLISDGRDGHSFFDFSTTDLIGANSSGSDVFFTTADSLLPQDTDTQVDIYDARVDGGFAAAPAAASCADGCQGSVSPPPVFGAPASVALAGGGNLVPVMAPRHVVHRRTVCVGHKRSGRRRCARVRKRSLSISDAGRRTSHWTASQKGGKR